MYKEGTWDWSLDKMEKGSLVYRTDWGYTKACALCLRKWNGCFNFYITNKYWNSGEIEEGYGITYSDLKSKNWKIQIK